MWLVRFRWLCAASLLLAGSMPTAQSQPSFHHGVSAEALVLNADAVVVGKVVDVLRGTKFNEATIAVEETLRGEHQTRRRVRFPDNLWQLGVGGYDAARLRKLQEDSPRLLVATREQPAQVCGLIYLTEANLRTGGSDTVYLADLTTLQQPAELLRVVRNTLRKSPGVKRIDTFPLTVPRTGGDYLGRGGSTTVAAPVDEALEKKAVQYVGSKERWRRTEGAAALKYFKSEEHIARLKVLLSDADFYLSTSAESDLEVAIRIYTVRQAAFETLKYWGVAVKAPVVEEKVK